MSTPHPHRRILLVDCDAFFVQVARLEDPDGAGKAELLIVGGAADGRGVVTSASYAVRKRGVHSGMPTARALRLCPEATVVGVPRRACVRRSREVREVLESVAPVVQAASIDEFYLDLGGMERLLGGETLEDSARRIREAVFERTAIAVSIGGGTNRLVAKLAVRHAKPAGVHVVAAGMEAAFVRGLPLAEIPGIGPALQATLKTRGLTRVEELLAVPETELRNWLGENRAHWLLQRIQGVDPSAVATAEPRKSISAERTFRTDIDDDERLRTHLMRLALSVGSGLRAEGVRARTVTVKLRDGDFTTRSASRTLPTAEDTDRGIYEVALRLLQGLREKRRTGARLLGLGASGLDEAGEETQLGLFEEGTRTEGGEREPEGRRTRAIDALRARFGPGAIVPARLVPRDPDEGEPT
jgi:DNA polymerase IV